MEAMMLLTPLPKQPPLQMVELLDLVTSISVRLVWLLH